jgi:hypothetical protein
VNDNFSATAENIGTHDLATSLPHTLPIRVPGASPSPRSLPSQLSESSLRFQLPEYPSSHILRSEHRDVSADLSCLSMAHMYHSPVVLNDPSSALHSTDDSLLLISSPTFGSSFPGAGFFNSGTDSVSHAFDGYSQISQYMTEIHAYNDGSRSSSPLEAQIGPPSGYIAGPISTQIASTSRQTAAITSQPSGRRRKSLPDAESQRYGVDNDGMGDEAKSSCTRHTHWSTHKTLAGIRQTSKCISFVHSPS